MEDPWSLSSLQPVPWQSSTVAVAVSDFLMLGFSKLKLGLYVVHKLPCSLASYSTFQCRIVSCNKCCGFFVSEHSIFLISKLFDAHFPSCSNLLLVHLWSPIVPNLIFWNFISFNKAHNFKGVKCGPCLLFLCAVWKFHKNPIKPRFICAASSTSLSDVSKWLCSFFKAMGV